MIFQGTYGVSNLISMVVSLFGLKAGGKIKVRCLFVETALWAFIVMRHCPFLVSMHLMYNDYNFVVLNIYHLYCCIKHNYYEMIISSRWTPENIFGNHVFFKINISLNVIKIIKKSM